MLELAGVSKSYVKERGLLRSTKRFAALHPVSFSLEAGECLGIVGASGSGKSTLGKLILGLDQPDEGAIRFRGADWLNASAGERHRLRRDLQASGWIPWRRSIPCPTRHREGFWKLSCLVILPDVSETRRREAQRLHVRFIFRR